MYWNSFRTDDVVGMQANTVAMTGGEGDTIHAYVARPLTAGPRPGIVLIHHMPGWDEFYQEFTERLARHHYDAICPNLYERFGHGTPEDVTAMVRAQGGVHDSSVVADAKASMEWLRSLPTNNGKVGLIGSCSGGRHAVLVASRVPGFDAVVDLWGGGVVAGPDQLSEARPVAPIDFTNDLNTPLLGLFGNEDQNPSPEQVDTHESVLKDYGKNYEFHRYDGAGHGFFNYPSQYYRYAQAMDGWEKVFAFFEKYLCG